MVRVIAPVSKYPKKTITKIDYILHCRKIEANIAYFISSIDIVTRKIPKVSSLTLFNIEIYLGCYVTKYFSVEKQKNVNYKLKIG